MGGAFTSPACCCTASGGFKLVVAQVSWFGVAGANRYGYLECNDQDRNGWNYDPCPGSVCSSYIPYSPTPPDHKYLGHHREIVWDFSHDRKVELSSCISPPCAAPQEDQIEHTDFHFRRSYDIHTDRFTGLTVESLVTTWDESTLGEPDIHLEGAEATARFLASHPPRIKMDAACGQIFPADGWGALTLYDSGYTESGRDISDSGISMNATLETIIDNTQACGCASPDPSYRDLTTNIGSFRITETLYDKFTSAEAYAYAVELLALWPLGNDTEYPWRTSCGGESYRLGALVTFNYSGGIEYPTGTPGVPGAIIGGPISGETWAAGAHALTGFAADELSGGSIFFNTAVINSWGWGGNTLVVGKWAEKKMPLPAHNYARPCGEDYWSTQSEIEPGYWAAAGVDPDTALCWSAGTPTGKLSASANVAAGETVTIDWLDAEVPTPKVYQFVAALTPVEGEVLLGATMDISLTHLKDAINHTGTPDVDYKCAVQHAGVSASYTSPVLTVTSRYGSATVYRHFLATSCSSASLTWAHAKLIGPECADPCNNTTPTGDFTTVAMLWADRERSEAQRMNGMAALCPGGSPCSDAHSYTVVPQWTEVCTQRNEAAGKILYVSPNAESFSSASVGYSFPSGNFCDDKYGYLWFGHIRQIMPDPLITCLGSYPFDYPAYPTLPTRLIPILLEESRCSEGSCPALPATPATPIFYCPDADSYALGSCGAQDSYGMQCPPL